MSLSLFLLFYTFLFIFLPFFSCRREAKTQTKATTINYLKNLRTLFRLVREEYAHEDQSFPRDFDGQPSRDVLNNMRVLDAKLGHMYKKTTKDVPQEQFIRKLAMSSAMPDYDAMLAVIDKLMADIPGQLDALTEAFGTAPKVAVRSDRTSSSSDKEVIILLSESILSESA